MTTTGSGGAFNRRQHDLAVEAVYEQTIPLSARGTHRLRHGDQEAHLGSAGAKLCTYRVDGRDVIVGFRPGTPPPGHNGAVLVPWPGRLRDGAFSWRGAAYQAPLTDGPRRNALHGLACWIPWKFTRADPDAASLVYDLPPGPAWPGPLRLEIAYSLGDDGLAVELTATNTADEALPYGAGFHPWLSTGGAALAECAFQVDAATHVVTDARLLPAGAEPVAGTPHDLRRPTPLAGVRLDDTWTDAVFDGAGRSWARLTRPDGHTVGVWAEWPLTCWQVRAAERARGFVRGGVAAIPATCPPDALNTGDRLAVLEPGQTHTVRWGIQAR